MTSFTCESISIPDGDRKRTDPAKPRLRVAVSPGRYPTWLIQLFLRQVGDQAANCARDPVRHATARPIPPHALNLFVTDERDEQQDEQSQAQTNGGDWPPWLRLGRHGRAGADHFIRFLWFGLAAK